MSSLWVAMLGSVCCLFTNPSDERYQSPRTIERKVKRSEHLLKLILSVAPHPDLMLPLLGYVQSDTPTTQLVILQTSSSQVDLPH